MTLKDLLSALDNPGLVCIQFYDHSKARYAGDWFYGDYLLDVDDCNEEIESIAFNDDDMSEWLIKLK